MPNSQWHVRQRDESESTVAVHDAVQDFLAATEVKRLQPKTQEEYTHVLTTFADWCSVHSLTQDRTKKAWIAVMADSSHTPIMLHQVNDQVVYCFLAHVQQTHKPSKASASKISTHTIANYAKGIKRFLNWCLLVEQYSDHVKAITVQRIKKPKIEEVILETFSSEQIEALKKACAKEESDHLQMRDLAIIGVLLDTGIRASELVTLTIGHVHLDPKDAHIRVFGKGSKWGEVGLGEEARRTLQKYLRTFREPTIEHRIEPQLAKLPPRQQQQVKRQLMEKEPMFVNRAGQPLTKSGLYQLVERLGEWASIEGVRCSPHTFRHTFSVMFMRKNNNDIYRLSKLLRHSSVKVTENYLKSLRQSEARKGVKSVLDNL
jgi:integrase/recombinase XerD